MTQTFAPPNLAIPPQDVSPPPSIVMTITFVPMIGVRRTLAANIPILIVTMAINVPPNHVMLSWDVNIRPSPATMMMHVLMIVVILTLDVSTLSLTVTTAILAQMTLVTTSKVAYTLQPIVQMVTSVRYGHVTPPLVVTPFHMYVATAIPAP
jgi:hypothetical protein